MREHLQQVAARLNDPATMPAAEARAGVIIGRLERMPLGQHVQAVLGEREPQRKIVWLRQLAGALSQAAQGQTPCASGCAECCHQTISLTQAEAAAISQATGIPYAQPGRGLESATQRAQRYSGQPCPFLKGGGCSIYDHRPYQCRLHFSLDRDALLCKIVPGTPIEAIQFDTAWFSAVFAEGMGSAEMATLADIRDYFPQVTAA